MERLETLKTDPRAIAAKYDRKSDRVIVVQRSGVSFMFPTSLAEGLSDASSDELAQVKVLADGLAYIDDEQTAYTGILFDFFKNKNHSKELFCTLAMPVKIVQDFLARAFTGML